MSDKSFPAEPLSNRALIIHVTNRCRSAYSELLYKYKRLKAYDLVNHLDWIANHNETHVFTVLFRIYHGSDSLRPSPKFCESFDIDDFRQFLNNCTELDFLTFLNTETRCDVSRASVTVKFSSLIDALPAIDVEAPSIVSEQEMNPSSSSDSLDDNTQVEKVISHGIKESVPDDVQDDTIHVKEVDGFLPIKRPPPPKLVVYATGTARIAVRNYFRNRGVSYNIADMESHPLGYSPILINLPSVTVKDYGPVVITDAPNNLSCAYLGITIATDRPPDVCESHSLCAQIDPDRLDEPLHFIRADRRCHPLCRRCALSDAPS